MSGRENRGQTPIFLYVRNRLLDSGSTCLRGRPGFPGAARLPKATDTCAAKDSSSAGSHPPAPAPTHHGTTHDRPLVGQRHPSQREVKWVRVHPCVGLPGRSSGSSTNGIRLDAPPCRPALDSARYSADTPVDTPLPGRDRSETAPPPTRSRYGGRRDSPTAHNAGRAPSSRSPPIRPCQRRPGDAHGWS